MSQKILFGLCEELCKHAVDSEEARGINTRIVEVTAELQKLKSEKLLNPKERKARAKKMCGKCNGELEKKEAPKEEAPKEEAPKEEAPKEEVSKKKERTPRVKKNKKE